MVRHPAALVAALLVSVVPAWGDVPVTLRGSPESMVRQNRVAKENELSFFRTPAQIHAAVESGYLVPLEGNESYAVNRISFPVARPELRLFIERFSGQYRAACGEKLVVTSLTRASARQPSNAHRLSVHPAGMAVDLRISQSARCRSYLESTLLSLEGEGVLDVTREKTPPHYHVALFPDAYLAYVGEIDAENADLLGEGGIEASLDPPGDEVPALAHGMLPQAGPADGAVADAGGKRSWLDGLLGLPARLLSLLLRD